MTPCDELKLECQHTITFGVRQQPLWCDACEKILMFTEEFIDHMIAWSADPKDWGNYLDLAKFEGLTFAQHMALGNLEAIQVMVKLLRNAKGVFQ